MKKCKWGIWLLCFLCLLSACATHKDNETMKSKKQVEKQEKKVSITVSGDILIEAPNYSVMGDDDSFAHYFERIKPYLKGDVIIGNQEVPIAGEELGIAGADYCFNAPKQVAAQLKELGFDVLTFANNHSYDRGYEGVVNTIDNLHEQNIMTTGAFRTPEEAKQPLIVEKNGIKIAILAYTYDTNQYIPEEYAYTVHKFLNAEHIFDEEHKQQLKSDVEVAKSLADAVIVAMHWGSEFTYDLDDAQQESASYLNELGVDMIIGNHPHTLQKVETLTNAEGKETFVIYSLGNLVSGSVDVDRASEMFKNMYEVGGIINCELVYDVKDKKVTIRNPQLTPYINHITYGYQSMQLIPFSDYHEELAMQHYQRNFSTNFTMDFISQQLHDLYDGSIEWK